MHIFYAVTIMNQNIRPRKLKHHSLFCFSSFLVPLPPSLFVYHRIIIRPMLCIRPAMCIRNEILCIQPAVCRHRGYAYGRPNT